MAHARSMGKDLLAYCKLFYYIASSSKVKKKFLFF